MTENTITKPDGMDTLTNSRKGCAMTCLRKHFIEYEQGVRPVEQARPLWMGSVFHEYLDFRARMTDTTPESKPVPAMTPQEAADKALAIYDTGLEHVDDERMEQWLIDREVLYRLMICYNWRWSEYDDNIEVVASELKFELPIINPESGFPMRSFNLSGKIDKIVKLADGRLALMEHKTTSKDLSPDSTYWSRLSIDSQISIYYMAAQQLGYDIKTVIYDVIRKPSIKPAPLTQAATKVLMDTGAYMGKNKETKELSIMYGNYDVLASDDVTSVDVDNRHAEVIPGKKANAIRETLPMYGDRLTYEIGENPDYYMQRKELARLPNEIDETRYELWQTAKLLMDCRNNNRWPRNTSACTMFGQCQNFNICTNGGLNPNGSLPEGFVRVDNIHQELLED